MAEWWLALMWAAAGGWSGALASDVLETVQAQRPPPGGTPVGLVLRGPVQRREARLQLEPALSPHRLVLLNDLESESVERARAQGIEVVVELTFSARTVTAHLWLIDGGVWTHAAGDPPTLLRRLEVDRWPPPAPQPAEIAPRPPPDRTAGPTLSKEQLFVLSRRVRAVAACGDQALLLLTDEAVRAYVPASPNAWHPVDPLPLAVLRTRDIRSRDPVGALTCDAEPDGRHQVTVGHGSFERSGTAELDVARRTLNWSGFLNGIPLASGPNGIVFGSVEPGTHRFEPTLFRTRDGRTNSFELAPFLEIRFVGDDTWWLVDPDLQVHRGQIGLDVRVGRGLVPYVGGFAASSPTAGPEAYVVYDAQGRERARTGLPGPVTAAAPCTTPSGRAAALVAVSVETGTELYRIDFGVGP